METHAECNDILGLTYSFLHIYKKIQFDFYYTENLHHAECTECQG